jgi:hypothetical protein
LRLFAKNLKPTGNDLQMNDDFPTENRMNGTFESVTQLSNQEHTAVNVESLLDKNVGYF